MLKSKLQDIPDYHQFDYEDKLMAGFNADINACATAEDLFDFVDKYSALWVLGLHKPEHVRKCDEEIVAKQFDPAGVLRCLERAKRDELCEHIPVHAAPHEPPPAEAPSVDAPLPKLAVCHGMEIRMPYSITLAILTAHHWDVPLSVAMHQLYCEGPHDDCF